MKNTRFILAFTLCIAATILLFNNRSYALEWFKISKEYLGTWSAATSEITVRTEPQRWHFLFTKGKADFSMTINADKTVSGHIGNARFENAILEKNWGLPSSWTGIIYIIKCGSIGKIFDDDPLDSKEVEIWVCPIKKVGTMEVEIRYGTFPMSGFICKKKATS
jgi:hypothetical protein